MRRREEVLRRREEAVRRCEEAVRRCEEVVRRHEEVARSQTSWNIFRIIIIPSITLIVLRKQSSGRARISLIRT